MSSPDLVPYTDLTLVDVDAQEVFDRALDDATAKLPGWEPREGNTEVVILEAGALEVMELVYVANRLPQAVFVRLLELYGLTLDPGAAATATATFTVANTAGYTIPAGTTVELSLGAGVDPLVFTLDANLLVPAGSTEATGAITAEEPGVEPNGLSAPRTLRLVDAVTYVESVTLATSPSGGRTPETIDDFLTRGTQRLTRLSEALATPAQFTAATLERAEVHRATTLDNYDPGQAGNPGDHPGHVTVAVAGDDGALLTAAQKTAIDEYLEDLALANLAVHVIDPTITAVAVDVTVRRVAGFDQATVEQNVRDVLTAYLDPDVWPWAGTVYRNELIAVIDGAAGVARVETLTTPAADVTLTGVAPLVTAGTLTVTAANT